MSIDATNMLDGHFEKLLPVRSTISNDKLQSEIKCGFNVSEQLKKTQFVQLDLLNELLSVCRKYDIKLSVLRVQC